MSKRTNYNMKIVLRIITIMLQYHQRQMTKVQNMTKRQLESVQQWKTVIKAVKLSTAVTFNNWWID